VEVAFAACLVEVPLQFGPALAVVFNSREMLPLRAKRVGKTVGETKGDKLGKPRFVAMRQVTALMPTEKTLPGILGF
jgi:hypothetical protein